MRKSIEVFATYAIVCMCAGGIQTQKWSDQVQVIKRNLAAMSGTPWKLVVGHHPIWTNGRVTRRP